MGKEVLILFIENFEIKKENIMDILELNKIVFDYNNLDDLIREKIETLGAINRSLFGVGNYIENIKVQQNRDLQEYLVEVTCDNSMYDSRDSLYFDFPLSWVLLSDDELKIEVQKVKEKKELEEQKKKQEAELAKKLEKERIELALLKELKEKYEGYESYESYEGL